MKLLPTIKETVVGEVERTELYSVVEDALLGDNPDGHDFDSYEWVHAYDRNKYWKEGDHLPIEMLQGVLDELKALNATHVQIMAHSDHRGYYFTGVKCELMPEDEIIERNKEKLATAIKNSEIALKFEEEELKKKRDGIETQKKNLKELE